MPGKASTPAGRLVERGWARGMTANPPDLPIEPTLTEFLAQQDRLLACIRQAEGLDLGRLRAPLTYLETFVLPAPGFPRRKTTPTQA